MSRKRMAMLAGQPLLCVLFGLFFCGCVARQRFSPDVATALRAEPMRRMEGKSLVLYYPARRHAQARRTLLQLERCASILRGLVGAPHRRKVPFVMPELPYNNAYVSPSFAGVETNGLIPTFFTNDFLELGIAPDAGVVGCHEMVHAVQSDEGHAFQRFLFEVFGDAATPQIGLDAWFWEGLAVHYEAKMLPGVGRPASPLWRGMLAAGVAGRHIAGGDLSAQQRGFFAGNHYLLGGAFIDFLAERYGEAKLWELVNVQSRSVFVPFGVNVRFWQVYDKSLSTLIGEFDQELAAKFPVRERPAQQASLRTLGIHARWASGRDGTAAFVSSDLDDVLRLTVLAPDGRTLVQRALNEVIPPRRLHDLVVGDISGLSVSDDGGTVAFVAVQPGLVKNESRLVKVDVKHDELGISGNDLAGVGAQLSPDGSRYLFVRPDGDRHDIVERDIATGVDRVIVKGPEQRYFGSVRYSPNADRLAVSVFERGTFRIWLMNSKDGERLQDLSNSHTRQWEPSWVDENRIVFEGEVDGRQQVMLADLRTGKTMTVSNAPYAAARPAAGPNGSVRFLNRVGWRWTLDEVQLPAAVSEQSETEVAMASAAASEQSGEADLLEIPIKYDEEASSVDNLFYPQGRAPSLYSSSGGVELYGLSLTGGDRLGNHSWAIDGMYQSQTHLWSGNLGYVNMQLAPFVLELNVSQLDYREAFKSGGPLEFGHRERILLATVTRSFWGNPIELGFSYVQLERDLLPVGAPRNIKLGGPILAAAYVGADGSPYAGASRALVVAGRSQYLPKSLSSLPFDMFDVGGRLVVYSPLPLSRRHTLRLDLRGRALAGSEINFLQVGGVQAGSALAQSRTKDVTESPLLPPGVSFSEAFRGFEDSPILGRKAGIAQLAYRYPLILDIGAASALGILPAVFVDQLNFELFGSAAKVDQGAVHSAAGAAISVGLSLWRVSMDLQYQVSKRFSDDERYAHLLMLGASQ